MNNLPEKVAAYLSSTRFMLPISEDESAAADENLMYRSIKDYVNFLSNGLGINVKLSIVYSDALRSEAIAIDDEMYIVHDRYLGQAVNMLNRLFLYNASKHSKIIYAHKLVSQIFSRYAFYEESVFAAQKYQDGKEDMDHQEKQKQDGSHIHGIYIHIQELYIILHEHAHHIFRTNEELLADLSKDVREWIRSYGEKESNKDVVMQTLLNADVPDDEMEFYKSNLDKIIEQGKLTSRFCEEISKRPDLVEEFCCDRLAILHMVPYLIRLDNIKIIDQIKAIVLCFLHLRTIQLLEARCSFEEIHSFEDRQNKYDIHENIYSVFYNARIHHIKEFCYDLLISSEDKFEEVHSEVSEMMYLHTDEILSPAESVMANLLYSHEIRDLMREQFDYIKEHMSESQHIQRVVSAILHNVPSNSD